MFLSSSHSLMANASPPPPPRPKPKYDLAPQVFRGDFDSDSELDTTIKVSKNQCCFAEKSEGE